MVFSHLGFWSGNLFLIAPFPDLCLLVPFYICWDMIQIDDVQENIQNLISLAMKTNGISENDIQRINSKSNIMSYETGDICLNRVFDELWIVNPLLKNERNEQNH